MGEYFSIRPWLGEYETGCKEREREKLFYTENQSFFAKPETELFFQDVLLISQTRTILMNLVLA